MSLKDTVKLSFYICLVSAFGFILAFAVYTRIFPPTFGIDHSAFDKTLLLSILCGLTGFVYYSKKEINNKQMGIRIFIQMVLLLIIVPSLLNRWSWIKPGIAGYAVVIIFVIVQQLVWVLVALKLSDKHAKQLNFFIQKRKEHTNIDKNKY